MYSYSDQLRMLGPIVLQELETKRMDCPFCGGRKTFAITRTEGKRLWNCFRASCGVTGSKSIGYSIDGVRAKLEGNSMVRPNPSTPFPRIVSEPDHHPAVVDYLKANNSYEAYKDGLLKVEYAPAENRILFYDKSKSGASGRALGKETPKWLVYGHLSQPFIVGSGSTAVIVEDIMSACSVARLPNCCGCAILGTSISPRLLHLLFDFDEVVVALDNDASRKSLDLSRQLEANTKTRTRFLSEDLKYLGVPEIKEVLGL